MLPSTRASGDGLPGDKIAEALAGAIGAADNVDRTRNAGWFPDIVCLFRVGHQGCTIRVVRDGCIWRRGDNAFGRRSAGKHLASGQSGNDQDFQHATHVSKTKANLGIPPYRVVMRV